MKQHLVDAFSSTTAHGLPKIVKAKRMPIKIMWTICFIISSGFCAYSVIGSLANYLRFDVVSLTRVIYEPFSEFPKIMLCNRNNLKWDILNEIVKEGNLSFVDQLDLLNMSSLDMKLEFTRKKIYAFISKNIKGYKNVSVQMSDMLISCRHGSHACNSSHFTLFFHFTHGSCYFLYSNIYKNPNIKPVYTFRAGFQNSLQIELFIGEPNHLDILSSSNVFQLFLLNSSDFFNKLDFVNLSPGFEYNIGIHRTLIEQIPKPYSSCEVEESNLDSFDSIFIKIFRDLNLNYRQMDCVDLCYQIRSENYCNCTDNILDFRYNSKLCREDHELKCIMHFYYDIFTQDNYIDKYCIPHCPLECKSIQLSTTVSLSKYPNENYFELLKNDRKIKETVFNSANWSYIKSSILKVNINYESLSYNYIKENAVMSVVDLLAYIGGQMGLFLGISFLSFVEIVEIFIELIYIALKKYE